MKLTCEVLGIDELTEEALNRLPEIRITGPNQVSFCRRAMAVVPSRFTWAN